MTPEEQAAFDAAQDKQIRDLATQIAQVAKLGFDPMTVRKGIISSVSDTTTPPTVGLNISGDTETLITEVRTLNNYTPLVGQTVLVAKQGTEIFLLGSISATNPGGVSTTSNGWLALTPSNGTNGANSNGNIYYRRIMDHGSWKMQWRGGWGPGGSTTLVSSGDALSAEYRPGSLRSMLCARDATGAVAAKLDFATDGTVTLVGGTTAPSGSTGSGGSFSVGDHAHLYDDNYGGVGEYFSTDSTYVAGAFSIGGHTHTVTNTVTAPTWVSLNGVEYFL